MNKSIAIIAGEPNSISSEIIFNSQKFKNHFIHKPLFVIVSISLLNLQKKKLKYKIKIKKIIFRLNKKIDLSRFESAELKFLSNINNEIIISYNKEKIKIEEIIKLIKNEDVEILDISTDEADLEDVFIELTKSQIYNNNNCNN